MIATTSPISRTIETVYDALGANKLLRTRTVLKHRRPKTELHTRVRPTNECQMVGAGSVINVFK